MRVISTLWFFLISSIAWCQEQKMISDSKEVIVTALCTKRRTVDELKVKSPDSLFSKRTLISVVDAGSAQKNAAKNSGNIRLCCGRTILDSACLPLWIVDGQIRKVSEVNSIDPWEIKDLDILKPASAMALFGSQGYNGAICVTTKNAKLRKFIIKDSLDGSPIPGATVSFISSQNKNGKFQFVADDSGIVRTDKLENSASCTIIVSAVGYTTAEIVIVFGKNNTGKEVKLFLGREIKNCDEVVLTSTFCPRRSMGCGGWFSCGVSGIRITIDSVEKEKIYPAPAKLRIYPNPVQKGAILNFQFDKNENKEKIVRVISLNGMTLLQQSFTTSGGKNVFQLLTDPRWAAGIYFVQLLYENGRVAASEKIILQ